ncbi:MAG: transporter substrate-binding domain-containing protein [Clostridiales bacterium]|nr:transporter substrate-binding domain-containing protein [Clostridiales bacterium]
MKKITKLTALALAACMVVGLTACSGGKKAQNPPAQNQTQTQTPAKTDLDRIKADGKIIMLTNAQFPPFEYLGDDNKPAGVDVDVANEIAKDLGVKLEIVNMDFDGLLNALQSGKGDFIAAGMTIKPERAKSVDFSVEYVTSSQYIIMRDSDKFNKLEDLKGKKVGVQLGTTGDYLVTDAINGTKDDTGKHTKGVLEGSGAVVSEYKTALEAALDLKAKRLDAVVVDKDPANAIAAENKGLVVSASAVGDSEKYAVAVKKGNKELLDAVNSTLNRLIKDGSIQKYIINHTK